MNPQILLDGLRAKREGELNAPNLEHEFTSEQFQAVLDKLDEVAQQISEALAQKNTVEVTNFPKAAELPEFDTSEVVNAIKSIPQAEYDNSDLIKAIKSLDLKPQVSVAAPNVHVDAPVLNVPETDFKPVIKAIKEAKPEPTVIDNSTLEKLLKENLAATKAVQGTIQKLKFPVSNTPTDPLIYYLAADIDDAGTVQYFGNTDNKGAWYIRKYDTSVSPKTIRLAFGQSNYATNWTNRASLTYNTWGS